MIQERKVALIGRILRAARFDGRLYQELQADPTATVPALAVVLLSGLSLGLAGVLGYYAQESLVTQAGVLIRSLAATLAGWVVLSLLMDLAAQFMKKSATFPSMLRAIGFANTPGILYIFVIARGTWALWINGAILTVILVWTLLTLTAALRYTLQISRWASFWLSAVGMLIYIVLRNLIA